MRRLRGEERADKTCLFHHFHPKSIMPSSPIDLREHLDHGRADPGAARLPRAAGPTMPPRTRIVAPFRPFSACARLHGQQRASGKQRTLSTSRWPWFVLARTPPRRGREEPEAQKHAAGGRSACRRASSEVVPRIRAPRAARTRRRIEVGVLLGTAGRPPRRDLAVLCQPPEPLTAAILKFRSWDLLSVVAGPTTFAAFFCRATTIFVVRPIHHAFFGALPRGTILAPFTSSCVVVDQPSRVVARPSSTCRPLRPHALR